MKPVRYFGLRALALWGVVLLGAASAPGRIIHVDDDANGVNDGSSWANAYRYLQDALTLAVTGDEIRLAQGVYKPDQGAGITPGDRTATFQLKDGVAVKGGYAGFGAPDPNTRDIQKYETVLSGDLAGNDVDVNDIQDLLNDPTRGENSYHIMTAVETVDGTVLDGLTITGGNANQPWSGDPNDPWVGGNRVGGGLCGRNCSVTLIDCCFIQNSAMVWGGAYNVAGAHMLVLRSEFARNQASCALSNDGCILKILGCRFWRNVGFAVLNTNSSKAIVDKSTFDHNTSGGIYNSYGSDTTISNCSFTKNTGSCVSSFQSSPLVINCSFVSNRGVGGVGILDNWANTTVIGCIFSGNMAEEMMGPGWGGAIIESDGGAVSIAGGTMTLSNCTLTGNYAISTGGAIKCYGSRLTVTNPIISRNRAYRGNQIDASTRSGRPCHVEIIYSSLYPSEDAVYIGKDCTITWNGANCGTDPCFADPGHWDPNGTPANPNDDFWVDGDYHLKSQAGRWEPKSQTWVKDNITSPCIDAGDPMSLVGAEPFPNGGRVNIGAYGGTAEASKSYFGEPPCEIIVAGDINGDCKVDFTDLALMGIHWLSDLK